MFRIRNISLAGKRLISAYGVIEFSPDGIGVVRDKELYEALLKIVGFEPVDEPAPVKKVEEETPQPKVEESAPQPEEEDVKKVVDLETFEGSRVNRGRRKKEVVQEEIVEASKEEGREE